MTIKLIQIKDKHSIDEFVAEAKPLCVCDFYVKDSEKAQVRDDHILYDDALIIDHHAPIAQSERQVSSTNMAIDYVRRENPSNLNVLINHTDCDAVLSALIMARRLEPLDIFGEAAIAADHTGQENEIADLLQALQDARDLDYSERELHKCLSSAQKDYEPRTVELLEKRKADRERARSFANQFQYKGDIAYLQLYKKLDSALLPPYLPQAKVILVASPMDNSKLEVKARLGNNCDNIKLNKLDLPDFGGRWNAGSTKRCGGTSYSLEQYAGIVAQKIANYQEDRK